MLDNCL